RFVVVDPASCDQSVLPSESNPIPSRLFVCSLMPPPTELEGSSKVTEMTSPARHPPVTGITVPFRVLAFHSRYPPKWTGIGPAIAPDPVWSQRKRRCQLPDSGLSVTTRNQGNVEKSVYWF